MRTILGFLRHHAWGILTLVIVFLAVHWAVVRYRKPGSMTVIEAQAMDMSQSGTPLGSAPVAVEEVHARLFTPSVTYTGSVAAWNDEEVYPRVTGWLTALYVYPGDRVRLGQIIGRLDSVELTSRLNEAEAGAEAAQHEYNMSSAEHREAVASKDAALAKLRGLQSALQEAQAQYAASQATHEAAQQEREAAQASLRDAEANAAAAQADAEYWRKEIQREARLLKAGAVSTEEYQREEAQSKGAEGRLAQALAGISERRAALAAAGARVRQAMADVEAARARVAQMQAQIQSAKAEVQAASAQVALNLHHTLHRAAALRQAEAQARTASIVRGYTVLRAEQDGVVTDRLAAPVTLVQPGMPILRIRNVDRLRLQAQVAEADLAGIRVGNPVTVTSLADPTLRFHARVTSLFNAANTQTRTVTVEAVIPGRGSRLVPGQYIVMRIATGPTRRLITVPLPAVPRDVDQRPYVWTVASGGPQGKTIYACVMHPEVQSDKPGKCYKCGMDLQPTKKGGKQVAHRVYVTLGPQNGGRIVVENGLHDGDQVIYRGQEFLNEGDPVAPTAWGATGPKVLPEPSGEMPNMPGMKMPSAPQSAPSQQPMNMPGMPS
ncbi:MAG: efflux RND transporter periplasmic adaptor subunit [Chthonomonadales bacterium]